jgi:hypothetical protein
MKTKHYGWVSELGGEWCIHFPKVDHDLLRSLEAEDCRALVVGNFNLDAAKFGLEEGVK